MTINEPPHNKADHASTHNHKRGRRHDLSFRGSREIDSPVNTAQVS